MDPYEELSDDDHVAFLQLENQFRQEMEAALEERSANWVYVTARYMNKVLAAANTLKIDALSDYKVNTFDAQEHSDNFSVFQRSVDSMVVQIRISNSRDRNSMAVGLTQAQKSKIHHFIEKIRAEVDSSAAPDAKKDKIFDILSSLAQEVSKARTRFERFADLARSLAGLSGEIEREGARPWWPWFEKIMGLLDDAKEAEPKLPKPPEIKRIEPPLKKLPKPGQGYGAGSDLDDDIPF